MNSEYLSDDEILYELSVRHIPHPNDMIHARSKLRAVFQSETAFEPVFIPAAQPNTSVAMEFNNCENKYKQVTQIPLGLRQLDAKRFYNKCLHLLLRLERLYSILSYSDSTLERTIVCMMVETRACVNFVLFTSELSESLDSVNPFQLVDELADSLTTKLNIAKSKPNNKSRDRKVKRKIRYGSETPKAGLKNKTFQDTFPMKKQKLIFSGNRHGKSVTEFLDEIQLFAYTENVSECDLFESANYFFVGPARIWYKITRTNYTTWKQLVEALKKMFSSNDDDFNMLCELWQRRQGKDELFHTYIEYMLLKFDSLNVFVSEKFKLRAIIRNLQAVYVEKLPIVSINTIEELKRCCERVDDSLDNID